MLYRVALLIFVLAASISAMAGSAAAQAVTAKLSSATLVRGSNVSGTVVISLPEGLHVNSNTPVSEYAIPTKVILSGDGLKFGKIEYPKGVLKKFQFSSEELSVYEGKVVIPFTVKVPRNFRGKNVSIKALVTYQACTDEVCYPPKDVELVMSAAVN